MAIVKSFPQVQGEEAEESNIEVAILNPDAVSVETDDGGIMVDFTGGEEENLGTPSHGSNLAEFMDDNELMSLSNELTAAYESDKSSRKEWELTYTHTTVERCLRCIPPCPDGIHYSLSGPFDHGNFSCSRSSENTDFRTD